MITHQSGEWETGYLKTRRNLSSRKRRLALFNISPDDLILDLGCGDGLNISILTEMGYKKIIGVDISRKLINKAKRSNPKIKFFLGKVESLPFRSGQFNIVLVDSVFHHILDYDEGVKEIRRVLAPNGLLCFIEPHRSISRSLIDFLCTLPLSKILPFFNKRRVTYLEEKDLMSHWLRTEGDFLRTLRKYKFNCIFKKVYLLSIIGEYRKN